MTPGLRVDDGSVIIISNRGERRKKKNEIQKAEFKTHLFHSYQFMTKGCGDEIDMLVAYQNESI